MTRKIHAAKQKDPSLRRRVARRQAIYFGQPLQVYVQTRLHDSRTISEIANECAVRLQNVLWESLPEWRVERWAQVFAILGRDPVSDPALLSQRVKMHTGNTINLDALTYAQSLSVIDASERFWAGNEGAGAPGAESIKPTAIVAVVGAEHAL